jgi:hypothetical protein
MIIIFLTVAVVFLFVFFVFWLLPKKDIAALAEVALCCPVSADTWARATSFGLSTEARSRALKWFGSGIPNRFNSSKPPYTCWRGSVAHGKTTDRSRLSGYLQRRNRDDLRSDTMLKTSTAA